MMHTEEWAHFPVNFLQVYKSQYKLQINHYTD